ncbi:cytochrome C oxidase subunit IV family protein [Flavobacterium enshiense]|uniref:cytochrome C oxidase subunit IV family protein n=1 Tax=Flavobacterium enshiense TaxID=1341165 RepID=UPI00345E004A
MGHSHESNTKRIWGVFAFLSLVTIVEVWLGIEKPHSLYMTNLLSMSLLNWIFIILTIVKAYYIMWAFMHLEGEKSNLRWSIVGPLVFLILYLVFILLVEADYVYEVFNTSFYKWIF